MILSSKRNGFSALKNGFEVAVLKYPVGASFLFFIRCRR